MPLLVCNQTKLEYLSENILHNKTHLRKLYSYLYMREACIYRYHAPIIAQLQHDIELFDRLSTEDRGDFDAEYEVCVRQENLCKRIRYRNHEVAELYEKALPQILALTSQISDLRHRRNVLQRIIARA